MTERQIIGALVLITFIGGGLLTAAAHDLFAQEFGFRSIAPTSVVILAVVFLGSAYVPAFRELRRRRKVAR